MLAPEFKEYRAGEKILEEGTTGDRVYILTEGEATVFFQNVRVGQLTTNQMFGVKSALTGTPRTATVVCGSERAFAMSISKDEFKQLIAERPELVEDLLIDLFRTIDELNSQVVKSHKSL